MIASRQRLLWAGLLASVSFAAMAQQPVAAPAAETPATATTTQAQPSAKPMDRAQRMEKWKARQAERLAALKDKLKLTPAQEGAWSSFASAQQPAARPHQRMDRAEFAKLTTPQRLDLMQQRMSERQARFAQRAEATRSFYAALTPEQQKTFDAEALQRFGRHGQHHRGHGDAAPAKG